MEPDKKEHHTMLKQKVSPIGEGEAMGPSPKKRNTADVVSNQALEASANVKGEGAPVNQEAQEGVMEGPSKSPEVDPQERDEAQPKPAPGDATLPAPEDSLPDDILHHEENDDEEDGAGAGASGDHDNSESAEDDTEITSVEISHYIVNTVDPDVINYGIKHALMSEIRRYGRQYGRIFKLLDEVRGPLEIRLHFVRFAIKEAARFKRYHLIYYLEKLLEKMMSDSTIRNVDLNEST
ncbi:integrator complex subunit 6-like [Arvicola amphibius]|uniref:integrator complex subunit 6-like n=1 Tax=Arvicola amphibius TaxID=1047088 RepID=UPI0018E32413|nr:integrator complex subunit 6-like [Arvicola amphibius]